jgi:hypothetical protein
VWCVRCAAAGEGGGDGGGGQWWLVERWKWLGGKEDGKAEMGRTGMISASRGPRAAAAVKPLISPKNA